MQKFYRFVIVLLNNNIYLTYKVFSMKKISRLFAFSLVFAICSANLFGQSATASATIVTPITISSDRNLSFGNVIAAATAGTVQLSPAGVRTATTVTLPATTGTVSSARFTITGMTGMAYTVTVPASLSINDGSGNSMTVNGFTHTATGTLTATTEVFTVGATLQVGANQAAGSYGPASFNVTVAYN